MVHAEYRVLSPFRRDLEIFVEKFVCILAHLEPEDVRLKVLCSDVDFWARSLV